MIRSKLFYSIDLIIATFAVITYVGAPTFWPLSFPHEHATKLRLDSLPQITNALFDRVCLPFSIYAETMQRHNY